MRKSMLLGAALALLLVCGSFAQAAPADPAAPYILEPGVRESFRSGTGTFRARVFCGDWKAIVQFTAGTRGQRYVTRTIYICERLRAENVRFVVRGSQLGPDGRYAYRLKVGRHDAQGNVTRWTHALTGNFTYG